MSESNPTATEVAAMILRMNGEEAAAVMRHLEEGYRAIVKDADTALGAEGDAKLVGKARAPIEARRNWASFALMHARLFAETLYKPTFDRKTA